MEEQRINSRPIRVSQRVYDFILSKASGVGDSPDRILRRLLRLPERKKNYDHAEGPNNSKKRRQA
jgi:negative regulator of replication initiation